MSFTKVTSAGIGSTELVTLDSLEVINNASIGGVLTYEDVTNVDSIGIITARAGVLVGSGITLSKDGDIFATGVTTSTTFVGNVTGDVTGAATQVTLAAQSSDTDCFPVFSLTATGNQALFTKSNRLSFNSVTGALSATSFVGDGSNLTGIDTDLVSDTSPQLGGDLDTNDFEILLDDNHKIKFGAGNDLNIYSTGTNGWVYTPQSTADLYLGTNAGEVYIQTGSGGNDTAIKVNSGGAVELYNNGTKQCQTFDGGLNFQDDKKAEFGASGDLKIYHSGSWNYIQSYNSKNLAIQVKDTENAIIAIPDGAVQLYHDNALRLSTWSDAVNIYGSEGADAILHLYADEGDDNADKWRILAGAAGQLDIANYSTGSWINHLSISGSGYVTKQNHPSFRSGRGSSSQSVNSGDAIIFNTTAGGSGRHNNGNHYSTTTGKFTAPVSGVYTFFTHVIYQGLSDGDSMIDAFHIYINNSQAAYSHKRSYYKNAYTGDGGYYTDTGDFTGTLTAGDEVWVRHSQGSRTIHANTNYCTFSGFLVS